MKNIYIVDEHQSSQRNGLGVFVKELIRNINSDNINICHLDINTDVEEFTIEEEDNIQRFCFPKVLGNPFVYGAKILDAFFRLYIKDSVDNVFILNHSPCEKLIESIRESHPLSKIVFIIHDFGWTLNMMGNVDKFREFVRRGENDINNNMLFKQYQEEIRMYKLVDKVVCLSKDSYNMLLDTYGVESHKIVLIPNGLADSYTSVNEEEKIKIKKNLYIDENEKIMVYVGRINRIKGGTALLASFSEILKTQPNSRLVIIGNLLDSKDILALGKKNSSKITFTGHISKSEIIDWYRIADIGLIPSYIEQCSYSAMEMMMYGLPIVASDGFSVRCMFMDGINAKVAKIGDRNSEKQYVKNITSAILKLLSSDDLRLELGKGSRNVFKSKYEVSHMTQKYVELIDKL